MQICKALTNPQTAVHLNSEINFGHLKFVCANIRMFAKLFKRTNTDEITSKLTLKFELEGSELKTFSDEWLLI